MLVINGSIKLLNAGRAHETHVFKGADTLLPQRDEKLNRL
jgi:hypothetical protein